MGSWAKNLWLGDFVEGENSVTVDGLRLLDPAVAVPDAITAHMVVEYYGCPTQIRIG